MKRNVKGFSQFVNENRESNVMEFDLIEIFPYLFSREARIDADNYSDEEADEDDNYTTDIKTTLRVERVDYGDPELADMGFPSSPEPGNGFSEFEDSSYTDDSEPVKVKMTYTDQENGFGNYGPYGGGHEVTIWAGLSSWDSNSVLSLFKDLWDSTDYFAY